MRVHFLMLLQLKVLLRLSLMRWSLRKLQRSETHRTCDESHGKNCGWDDPGDDSHWWNAIRLCPWSRYNRCYIHHSAAPGEILVQERSQWQEPDSVLCFCWSGESIWPCPREVLWWAIRKVGVEEWIVRLVQAMYNNARSRVRVGSEYSEEFEVGVGVHQGSVLSPLLFIIVLEALSRDFRVGVPWELFFADDLVIIATSLEECVERVKAWKEGLESKGLHVNMTKTKFMASGLGLDILHDSGKFPYAVCRTGVGRSSIRCSKCNLWVHYEKCSGLKTLSEDLTYECPRCRGVQGVRPVDGRPFKEVEVGDCVLEAVDRFCYLGDMLSAGGGCMAAATARCRCAWGKFRENLPLLTSKPVPFDLRGRLFSFNVRSSMLHGTETWPMTSAALHRLCRNYRAMIRWICGVKPSDDPSMDELHAKLGICDLAILVRERRLRWFGHVLRSNGEINRVRSRPVPGRKGPGRPKKTWEECVKQDLEVGGLSEAGTQDRLSWRSSVKNSRQEATPSYGSLPQSMAAPPAQRVLGMRTRSFNKTGFDWFIWLIPLSPFISSDIIIPLCIDMTDNVWLLYCWLPLWGHYKSNTLRAKTTCWCWKHIWHLKWYKLQELTGSTIFWWISARL